MHSVLKFCIVLVCLALARFIYQTCQEWQYRRLARKHGCEPPQFIKSSSLGISRVVQMIKRARSQTILQQGTKEFEQLGTSTFRAQTIGRPLCRTKDPAVIKCVLATHFNEFDLGARYEHLAPHFLGDGIFTLSGGGWHHSRALLRPQFANEQVSRVEDLEPFVDALVHRFKQGSANGGYVDVQELFFMFTLDTATDYLFGESTRLLTGSKLLFDKTNNGVSADEFGRSFNACLDFVRYRMFAQNAARLVVTPSFVADGNKCRRFTSYYVDQVLKEKRGEVALGSDKKYFFLRELAKETDNAVLMRDQALNILVAGRDTTASLLSITMCLLARDKSVLTKLRNSILTDFGTGTDTITFSTLKRSPYLKNVINEALRLYPIVPANARYATKDTVLPTGGGVDGKSPLYVRKGDTMAYSTWALHRDPEIWGQDANEFRPERWDDFRPPPWTFIPFNGGPRICLGQQFALTEASYTLVRVLQQIQDFDLAPEKLAQPLRPKLNLTASALGGVPLNMKPV